MHENLPQYTQDKIMPEPMSGCWLWIGSKDRFGYGRLSCYSDIKKRSKNHLAHRIIYELVKVTKIPKGMLLCHKCDNPACVNPEHMFVGSPRGNNIDAAQKGRLKTKISLTDAKEILSSGLSAKEISSRYGISTSHAFSILKGEHWNDMEERHA